MNPIRDKMLEAACVTFSVAFVCTSFGLLISGALCFYGKSNSSLSPSTCESIYVSGLLMSFIVGAVLLFNILFCLINRLHPFPEDEPVPKPVTVKKKLRESKGRSRSSSNSEEEVVINVKKKVVEGEPVVKNKKLEEEGTFAVENPIKKKRSASS